MEPLDDLARLITTKLHSLRSTLPSPVPTVPVVREVLEVAFYASLRSEEGRFLRTSITFAHPNRPEIRPHLRRHCYPSFTKFERSLRFDVGTMAKLSRAVDQWVGSLAVFGTTRKNLAAWGIIDQAVGGNLRLHQEPGSGFSLPGLFTVNVDGVGDLSAYHGRLFLGAIRKNIVVSKQHAALQSTAPIMAVVPYLRRIALGIKRAVPPNRHQATSLIEGTLLDGWIGALSRLCIGIRRNGAGGTLLLTGARSPKDVLHMTYGFPYDRLASAVALYALDRTYHTTVDEPLWDMEELVPSDMVVDESLAEADLDDRESELAGALKLVASLASLDGATVLTTDLKVLGFGAKIDAPEFRGRVYDGPALERGTVRPLDITRLGTRHGSAIRYCAWDRKAIALVVSQDGDVRMIAHHGTRLTLWESVKTTDSEEDVSSYQRVRAEWLEEHRKDRGPYTAGYTPMPKSVRELLRLARPTGRHVQ
jgi:hypothetical protein